MSLSQKAPTAYLVLQSGEIFKGHSMGMRGVAIGELVFNTSTASYQDILTDPTYYGQIVAQTYPLVGNRGVERASQSEIMANGYIVREWCDEPTDVRDRITLDEYLREREIVGLCNIDTRRLTRLLRDGGYIKAAITDNIDDIDGLIRKMEEYSIAGAVRAVSITEPQDMPAENEKFKLAVVDYGTPRGVLKWFTDRDVSIRLFPAFASAEDIAAYSPDGIMLSDGPGDPDEEQEIIDTVSKLTNLGKPILGIGLGHQILAVAKGMKCEKMPHAHRGSNQPVRNLENGKIMITNQNHAYAIAPDSVKGAEIFLENVNDHSTEGLKYKDFKAFTVQFMPSDGHPLQDTAWVFDEFVEMMKEEKENA